MALFLVVNNFPYQGSLRTSENTLEIPDVVVLKEMKQGKHEDNKSKWNSGLLNHCVPADDHTRDLLTDKVKPKLSTEEALTADAAEEKKKEIERLRDEFDKIGKAYNPKWAIDKLQKELKIAQKSGAAPKKDPEGVDKVALKEAKEKKEAKN